MNPSPYNQSKAMRKSRTCNPSSFDEEISDFEMRLSKKRKYGCVELPKDHSTSFADHNDIVINNHIINNHTVEENEIEKDYHNSEFTSNNINTNFTTNVITNSNFTTNVTNNTNTIEKETENVYENDQYDATNLIEINNNHPSYALEIESVKGSDVLKDNDNAISVKIYNKTCSMKLRNGKQCSQNRTKNFGSLFCNRHTRMLESIRCEYVDPLTSKKCNDLPRVKSKFCRRHEDVLSLSTCKSLLQNGIRCTQVCASKSDYCHRHGEALKNNLCTYKSESDQGNSDSQNCSSAKMTGTSYCHRHYAVLNNLCCQFGEGCTQLKAYNSIYCNRHKAIIDGTICNYEGGCVQLTVVGSSYCHRHQAIMNGSICSYEGGCTQLKAVGFSYCHRHLAISNESNCQYIGGCAQVKAVGSTYCHRHFAITNELNCQYSGGCAQLKAIGSTYCHRHVAILNESNCQYNGGCTQLKAFASPYCHRHLAILNEQNCQYIGGCTQLKAAGSSYCHRHTAIATNNSCTHQNCTQLKVGNGNFCKRHGDIALGFNCKYPYSECKKSKTGGTEYCGTHRAIMESVRCEKVDQKGERCLLPPTKKSEFRFCSQHYNNYLEKGCLFINSENNACAKNQIFESIYCKQHDRLMKGQACDYKNFNGVQCLRKRHQPFTRCQQHLVCCIQNCNSFCFNNTTVCRRHVNESIDGCIHRRSPNFPECGKEVECEISKMCAFHLKLEKERPSNEFPPKISKQRIENIENLVWKKFTYANLRQQVCASCGRRIPIIGKPSIKLKTLSSSEIPNIEKLKFYGDQYELPNDMNPVQEFKLSNSEFPQLNGLLLDKKGLCTDGGKLKLNICTECLNDLNDDQVHVPKYAYANDTFCGDIPEELTGLTLGELLCLRRYRICGTTVKVKQSVAGISQRGIRNHFICFPQSPESLLMVLPPPKEELHQLVNIILVRNKKADNPLTVDHLRNVLKIRKEKLRAAILKKQQIDVKWLSMLSEQNLNDYDEVDESLMQNPITINDSKQKDAVGEVGVDNHTLVPEGENEAVYNRSALIDTSINDIPVNELFNEMKLEPENEVVLYPCSNNPVTTYSNEDFFPFAFPNLFPYGLGGFELRRRRNKLSLVEHVQLLLQRHDQRFVEDPHFIFVAFNIIQRREICKSVSLNVKKSDCESFATLVQSLTPEVIQTVIDLKANGNQIPYNHPARLFQNKVSLIASSVKSSANYKKRFRNFIKSTCIKYGLTSMFLTVSPADLHNPLPLVFGGLNVNIDSLASDTVTNLRKRAEIAAKNPVSLVEFHHVLMDTITQDLLCLNHKEGGIFGPIASYFGVDEDQMRGALHNHMVIWLRNSLTGIPLYEKLKQDESFRKKFIDYSEQVITTSDNVFQTEDNTDINVRSDIVLEKPQCFKFPNPNQDNYNVESRKYVQAIMQKSQHHKCGVTCFKYGIVDPVTNEPICRLRYPNKENEGESYFDEDTGHIFLHRPDGNFVDCNKTISLVAGCNNNIQIVQSGVEALGTTEYITDYVAKCDDQIENQYILQKAALSSLLKTPVAEKETLSPAQNISRAALLRTINKIHSNRQVCATVVVNYLLQLPIHHTPESYRTIVLSSVIGKLCNRLKKMPTHDPVVFLDEEIDDEHDEEDEDTFQLQVRNGEININLPILVDYQYRSDRLKNISLYEYASYVTYKSKREIEIDGNPVALTGTMYEYQTGHPCSKTHYHRLKQKPSIPNIIASFFSLRSEELYKRSYYSILCLVLFMPWKSLEEIIEDESMESIIDKYKEFEENTDEETKKYMFNLQALHRCKEEAVRNNKLRQSMMQLLKSTPKLHNEELILEHHEPDENLETDNEMEDEVDLLSSMCAINDLRSDMVTNEGLDIDCEDVLAALRVDRGSLNSTNIDNSTNDVDINCFPSVFSKDVISSFRKQYSTISKEYREAKVGINNVREANEGPNEPTVTEIGNICTEIPQANIKPLDSIQLPEIGPFINRFGSNEKQIKSFLLVIRHLKKTIQGENPPPLYAAILGEGGTGKSYVIKIIREYFEACSKLHWLSSLAFTNAAALNIDGQTIHSSMSIKINEDGKMDRGPQSDLRIKEKMSSSYWNNLKYICIDEVSMIDLDLMQKMLDHTKKRMQNPNYKYFDGISVIFLGDFCQLQPITRRSLYDKSPKNYGKYPDACEFWNTQLQNVVILDVNERANACESLQLILRQFRSKNCNKSTYDILQSRLISKNPNVDLNDTHWRDAPIIVQTHNFRDEINKTKVHNHSYTKKKQLHIVPAVDRINDTRIVQPQILKLLRAKVKHGSQNNLERRIYLAEGAKIMLTTAVCNEIGLCNGTTGTVIAIIPTEESDKVNVAGYCVYKNPPVILFSPDNPSKELLSHKFPFIDQPGVVPLFAKKETFYLFKNKSTSYKIKRYQLPITLAYSITDYKSQGQTFPHVILDLSFNKNAQEASPYVMVSRATSLKSLLVLRLDGETKKSLAYFNRPLHSSLLEEFKRLDKLNMKTIADIVI